VSRRLKDRSASGHPRVIVGVALVLLGAVLLFDRLDLGIARDILRFWPLLVIAYGLQQFFAGREGDAGRSVPMNGVIWIVIGGVLLLNSLGVLRMNLWALFWPVVLIAVGLRLMTRPAHRWPHAPGSPAEAEGEAASADVGPMFALLSGVKRVCPTAAFRGTDITVFMGGAHLDLRRAVASPGSEAVIDVFIVMGGCELFVPPDWIVSAPLLAVLGGVDDKRIVQPPTVIEQATTLGSPPRLVLRGMMLMGGITIRS